LIRQSPANSGRRKFHQCQISANFSQGDLPMAKERAIRSRITIEVDPVIQQEIAQWAVSEGRPVSNLLRRVLSEIIDRRMAAQGTATRRPIPKQLTA
jgi:hypothetical protein